MKTLSPGHFYGNLHNKKEHYPWTGQIELTYNCNLACIHCYCKGSEDEKRELETKEWKEILDEIHREGCLWLVFTGGDPLVRNDFLDIYFYAKKKGFIITIFTNGELLTSKIIDYLAKSPPHSIEITLNGITEGTYEKITKVKGSFYKVLANIKRIKEKNLPLILKSNCLRQNKDEIAKIKAFADNFLGKENGKFYFGFDPMIYPRLNQDKTPCNFRLSFRKLLEVKKKDPDIWQEYEEGLHRDFPSLERDRVFSYHCNSWMTQFFINPYGRLKFCQFTDDFSVDLKDTAFADGFYNIFPKLLDEKFKTNSKCRDCSKRAICYYCPPRAYLETGNREGPVPYFCELAKEMAEEKERFARLDRFTGLPVKNSKDKE